MKRLLPTLSFSIYHLAFSAALLFLASCTLYMDEPEDAGRILRTGEGYDEVETITLPEGQGTVSYQYSQNTIPIDDVVEQYIVKVESDTILYFSFATPEELLPEVGEMMTCSFRDRFPNAFCHKCIERTEQDGIYRCVFRKCGFDEAFAKLKFDTSLTELVLPEGASYISEEEMDSIMSQYEDDDASAGVRSSSDTATRTTDGDRKEFNPIRFGLSNFTLNPNVLGQGLGTITANVWGTIGGYTQISYDTEAKSFYTESGYHGDLEISATLEGGIGVRYESPVAIPVAGLKADLIIAGINAGLTVSPYLDVRERTKATFGFSCGIDIATSYTHVDKEDDFKINKNKIKKKKGQPALTFKNEDTSDQSGIKLNIRRGDIITLGLGAELFGSGAQVQIGADIYSDYKLYVDKNEYESPSEFRQRFYNVPVYNEFFVEATVSAIGFNLPVSIRTDPSLMEGKLSVPLLPVYKEGSAFIYCSDVNPRTFTMGYQLEDPGLLSSYIGGIPQIKVFEDGINEAADVFDLKWEDGSYLKKCYGTKKSNNIRNNREYIAQANMAIKATRFNYAMPIIDIPFIIEMPELLVSDNQLSVVQTLTPQNATPQELANPSVIARKGDTYAWVQNGAAYRYRYKVDVPIKVEGARLIRTWGIQLGTKNADSSNFSHKESKSDLSIDYVVRMTWFANEPSIYLYFRPWADTQDAKGNKGGKLWFKSAEIIANYSTLLDKQFSVTDKSPDFEKSRSMYDTPWNVATTDLPFGDKPVIGDIELIPIE